eukprot:11074102-Ditylum_brightwellii.AAC.1
MLLMETLAAVESVKQSRRAKLWLAMAHEFEVLVYVAEEGPGIGDDIVNVVESANHALKLFECGSTIDGHLVEPVFSANCFFRKEGDSAGLGVNNPAN